jgi:hypothetical protein
MPKFPGR